MERIVVGLSKAETSHKAARTALKMAEAFGATVRFVWAIPSDESETVEVGTDVYRFDEGQIAQEAAEDLVRSFDPEVEWKVEVAEKEKPAKALVAAAERIDADLIVVGNVRMQGAGRFLGSVGNDVAHHAPCDVMIVKTV